MCGEEIKLQDLADLHIVLNEKNAHGGIQLHDDTLLSEISCFKYNTKRAAWEATRTKAISPQDRS